MILLTIADDVSMPSMKLSDLVLAIPHASTHIPPDIRRRIPHGDDILLQEPDLYTDRIFNVPETRMILAEVSRVVADCNRAPDEMYTEGKHRFMGVIMLCLAQGYDTFDEDPTFEEMQEWIDRFHKPFHSRLAEEMKTARFLVDCHSLSSTAQAAHVDAGHERADIVLGNREYTICSAETTQWFRDWFETRGYSVAINDPYPGRYITGAYCSRLLTPGIQIEINRKLYMNEETLEPYDDKIAELNEQIQAVLRDFCTYEAEREKERSMVDLSENAE